ncbi:actin cytoskeleton-regulatory complex protein PAN1-like [Homarus americanus]|uniref:actin cytoskeleton-regulatory complex protein PAN1-like n=1 Tax=Homarus americanus TaxID=6706 RepID=UPI001C43A141|nr:actin cytoskeleton-regulatory complex protein PAN1-like [Homarus americanus]
MQDTNHFLKAALQVGPWRITRRVMLFVIVFCVVLIVFGTFILKTHKFDDDDDDDWDDDDDDDEDEKSISSGDSIMFVLIGLAGMAGVATVGGCFMATHNTPRQLGGDTSSVFTLSGVTTHQQVAPRPSAPETDVRQTHHVPRQIPNTTKAPPPHSNGFPHSPSYPRNPHYPPDPPPSYSAPSYPVGGRGSGRRTGGVMPRTATRVVSSPPRLNTISDLPPPYAPPVHHPQRR